MAGLQGLQRRRQLEGVRQQLAQQQGVVSNYLGDLSKYEQEQIVPVEQQIASAKHEEYAFEQAKKLAQSGKFIPVQFIDDDRVQYYYKEFVEQQQLARNSFEREVANIQASLPEGEKLLVDFKNMRVTGISSDNFRQSIPLDSYNRAVQDFNAKLGQPASFSTRDLSPTDRVRDFSFNTGFSNNNLIPTVAAQSSTGAFFTQLPADTQRGVSASQLQKLGLYVEEPEFGTRGGATALSNFGAKVGETAKDTYNFLSPGSRIEREVTSFYNPVLASVGGIPRVGSTVKVPTRGLAEPSFVEIQQPLSVGGRQVTASAYQITQEVRPPMNVLKVGKQGLFGADDIITSLPPKVSTTRTQFPVINEGGALTFSARSGRQGNLNLVSGKSVPRDLADLERLTPTERLTWQRLAERITGRPVSLENVPRILNQNAQLSQGNIQQTALGKVTRQGEGRLTANLFEDALAGRATSRFTTASQFEQTGQTPVYDIFSGRVVFKDVSKPLARATGQTPSMSGTIFKVRQPLVIGENTGVASFRTVGTRPKTPLQSTFSDLLTVTPKPIPKVSRPSPSTKLINTRPTSQSYGTSSLLFGGGSGDSSRSYLSSFDDSLSDFARGLQGQASRPAQATSNPFIDLSAPSPSQRTQFRTIQTPSGSRLSPQASSFLNSLLNLRQSSRQVPGQLSLSRVTQTPRQPARQVPRQDTLLRNLLRQPGRARQRFTDNPFTPRRPPKLPTPRPRSSPSSNLLKLAKRQEGLGLFEVFGRRRGKDISLGVFPSGQQATRELREFLTGTLGASGFLTLGGRRVRVNLGNQFRPAKRDPFRIVQRRGYRLGTRAEVNEILSSPRGKKVRWF